MSENESVFNWTFCQLLTIKPNCTKTWLGSSITPKYYIRLVRFTFFFVTKKSY